jgi:hypothetical protein
VTNLMGEAWSTPQLAAPAEAGGRHQLTAGKQHTGGLEGSCGDASNVVGRLCSR